MKPAKKTTAILIAAAGVASLAFALTQTAGSTAIGTENAIAAKPTASADPKTPSTFDPSPFDSDGVVQIALLLDTSSSMSGLINQARTQLWKIVNELAASERNGHRPRLEIALYEYGKPSLGAETGFIRQVAELTEDLDRVSEQLFALATSGGDEYAGHVIQTATQNLSWSEREGDLKLIFIAGNEGFNQGTVDYRQAIAQAREKDIIVNTIYCGGESDSVRAGWQHGAQLAMGRSLNIDHNHVAVHIASPHDDEIARLGVELNETYVGYSTGWRENVARQKAQDVNAHGSGSMVARSVSKASALYSNAHWDLIDGLENGAVSWESLDEANLPDNLRAMSTQERKDWVAAKRAERAEIQRRIRELSKARDEFVAKKRRQMSEGGTDTLDTAMIAMVREQAGKKGYQSGK